MKNYKNTGQDKLLLTNTENTTNSASLRRKKLVMLKL